MVGAMRKPLGILAAGVLIAVTIAACGNSPAPGLPGVNNNGGGGGGGSALAAGLSSNLDKLDSYQFSENIFGSSSGNAASPGDSGTFSITGTVVNKPVKAMLINDFGMQYIVIGTQAWTSFDGTSWTPTDPSSSSMTDLLPGHDYSTWFDQNATNFTVAGNETKNGVQCIHFKGNSSLGALYQGIAGVSANFQADLWVASDGNYPVSGVYGFSASSGGQSGSFGFQFDVTHINDASNKVTQPTNIIAIPS
jgi:hypothetical protein